jgi:hypothetical protein
MMGMEVARHLLLSMTLKVAMTRMTTMETKILTTATAMRTSITTILFATPRVTGRAPMMGFPRATTRTTMVSTTAVRETNILTITEIVDAKRRFVPARTPIAVASSDRRGADVIGYHKSQRD